MRDPKERLRDMLEAMAAIERYLHRGKASFEHDELLQGWFVRNLQIIGEAARALPEEVRALAPEIEWPKIVGMRNVLVHGYFDIDTRLGSRKPRRPGPQAPGRAAPRAPGGTGMKPIWNVDEQRGEAVRLDSSIAANLKELGYGG